MRSHMFYLVFRSIEQVLYKYQRDLLSLRIKIRIKLSDIPSWTTSHPCFHILGYTLYVQKIDIREISD
jgi:hypothetical protein